MSPSDPLGYGDKTLMFAGNGNVLDELGLRNGDTKDEFCGGRYPSVSATKRSSIALHTGRVVLEGGPTFRVNESTIVACHGSLPTCEILAQEEGYYLNVIVPKKHACFWSAYEAYLKGILGPTVHRDAVLD